MIAWLADLLKFVSNSDSDFHLTKMFADRFLCRFPLPRLCFRSSPRVIRSTMASQRYSNRATPLAPLSPRDFQSTGFEVIDPSQMVEEERLPFYNRDHYYPMRIGEVLKDRYQVVAKLGYGASSTVWLCRDLRYFKPPPTFD